MITIAVDFDGTIVDHRYPDIGQPVPGAVRWLQEFAKRNARIILWTMRSGPFLDEAESYVSQYVDLYGSNKNPSQDSWTKSPKAYAHVYIDDAAFGCPLVEVNGFARPCVDWTVVGPRIVEMLEKNT